MSETGKRYDEIGKGYAAFRREDRALRDRIDEAIGDACVVLNVGAGSGSYEPSDRRVIAVEPSEIMVRQRGGDKAPAVRAVAGALPLADQSVDVAMTILSLHHWHPFQRQGVMEMARVARDRIIIVTIDPIVCGSMWLMADYLPEVARLDQEIFPMPATICGWLEGDTSVTPVPIARHTPDWTLMSFWAHPERVLDVDARNATSGFARQSPAVIDRVVRAVAADLESGAWDERHGHLRQLEQYDAGLRLLTIELRR